MSVLDQVVLKTKNIKTQNFVNMFIKTGDLHQKHVFWAGRSGGSIKGRDKNDEPPEPSKYHQDAGCHVWEEQLQPLHWMDGRYAHSVKHEWAHKLNFPLLKDNLLNASFKNKYFWVSKNKLFLIYKSTQKVFIYILNIVNLKIFPSWCFVLLYLGLSPEPCTGYASTLPLSDNPQPSNLS